MGKENYLLFPAKFYTGRIVFSEKSPGRFSEDEIASAEVRPGFLPYRKSDHRKKKRLPLLYRIR
jgi:hypothetical protein